MKYFYSYDKYTFLFPVTACKKALTGTGKEIEIEQKWRCNMDKELPVSAWPGMEKS